MTGSGCRPTPVSAHPGIHEWVSREWIRPIEAEPGAGAAARGQATLSRVVLNSVFRGKDILPSQAAL